MGKKNIHNSKRVSDSFGPVRMGMSEMMNDKLKVSFYLAVLGHAHRNKTVKSESWIHIGQT